MDIKYLDIKKLLDDGILFEINRKVLHPLGLALEIGGDKDGNLSLGGVWDYQDDPEGMIFDGETFLGGEKKLKAYMKREGKEKLEKRKELLGYTIQGEETKLKAVLVDFNCGLNDEGLMRLNTIGSLLSIQKTGAVSGEEVLLFDGDDCWVEAILVKKGSIMYGKFDWADIRNEE